jgi:hypothetical protein
MGEEVQESLGRDKPMLALLDDPPEHKRLREPAFGSLGR